MSEIDNQSKISCPFCGFSNDSNTKFCGNCGTKLEDKPEIIDVPQTEGNSGYQEEIKINYEPASPVYSSSQSTYTGGNSTESGGPVYGQVQNGAGNNENKGLAIASMICGIVSIICCCFWYISIVIGIVAIVLGIISMKKSEGGRSMAVAGIVTGSIGVFFCIILGFLIVLGFAVDSTYFDMLDYYLY